MSRSSAVTAALCRRRGVGVRLLPATDDPLRTRVTLAQDTALGPAGTEVGFQDYFVRLRHDVAVSAVRFDGARRARPAPGVLEALETAEVIVVCPSNPVVSIAPLLAVPGIPDGSGFAPGPRGGGVADRGRLRPEGPGRSAAGRAGIGALRRGSRSARMPPGREPW